MPCFVFLSMFPPQIMLLALFQILVQYKPFNTLTALVLVYAATELPLTIYLLRAFFAQIPTELEEAARIDGCSDWSLFWRIMLPMPLPAVATTVRQQSRTLPLAIQFLVSDQYFDIGMLATGARCASVPAPVGYSGPMTTSGFAARSELTTRAVAQAAR